MEFPSKNQFTKNCLKLWRNISFDEGNLKLGKKNIILVQFKIVQNFTIFVRSTPVEFPSKIQFSKNCLKLWRNTFLDEGNK